MMGITTRAALIMYDGVYFSTSPDDWLTSCSLVIRLAGDVYLIRSEGFAGFIKIWATGGVHAAREIGFIPDGSSTPAGNARRRRRATRSLHRPFGRRDLLCSGALLQRETNSRGFRCSAPGSKNSAKGLAARLPSSPFWLLMMPSIEPALLCS